MAKRRKHSRRHLKLIVWLLIFLVVLALSILIFHRHADDVKIASKASTTSLSTKSPDTFNKNQYSVNDSSSLWVVVNKGRVLPRDYEPAGLSVPGIPLRFDRSNTDMSLRSDAAGALKQLSDGATKAGLRLMLSSGYRSYSEQVGLYSGYVSSYGQAAADTFSARAGYSEHQTGLAADLEPASRQCEIDACFADTPEGKWLAANAYQYGFIIRYPADKTQVTGYEYEPWHVRYVGTALSTQMHTQSIETLEEFFGLQPYTSYPINSYQLM
jgi:D-alanyl-D-alanine carboxypeptidase